MAVTTANVRSDERAPGHFPGTPQSRSHFKVGRLFILRTERREFFILAQQLGQIVFQPEFRVH
jgi:hypothetical protein